MVAFGNCQDLVSYARIELDRLLEQSYKQGGGAVLPGAGLGPNDAMPESEKDADEEGAGDDGSSDKGGAPDHSKTNVQEQGVDEPDLVKTDGQRMYSLSRGVLRVLDLTGDKAQLTDRLQLSGDRINGHGSEMLIHGNKILIVMPHQYFADAKANFDSGLRLVEVDVSVPGQAKVLRNLDLEGQYVSARLIGSVVRLVFTTEPKNLEFRSVYEFLDPNMGVMTESKDHEDIPPEVLQEDSADSQQADQSTEEDADSFDDIDDVRPSEAIDRQDEKQARWDQAVQKARVYNRQILSGLTEQNLLPRYRLSTPDGVPPQEGLAYGCEQAMRPGVSAGVELLSVLSIDLNAGLAPARATGVVASGATVYASASSLYVATRSWMPDFEVGSDDMVGVGVGTAGAVADAPDLGPAQAMQARQATLTPQVSRRQTYVHKFDISDPLRASYRASGLVNGELLNQFAMSEHQGVLRVAATRYLNGGWEPSDSLVTTLQEQGDKLVQLGEVTGLGKTEMIRSVRFMGDVGYVVTFRQTDPLYTVDLKNPANPRVLGELKIEGFSAYLHPLAPGYLLGVGRDADHEGRIKGLQVSVFDVTDLGNPRRIHNYTLADAHTSARFDHRAFLYWPATKSVVLPVQGMRPGQEEFHGGFASAMVFDVDPVQGIHKRAEISHPSTVHHEPGSDHAYTEPTPIDRSVVIGERLWTLSYKGVKASKFSDATELDWLSYE